VSIGETLIVARERAGLTVADVAEATRLRQTLVRAIEHDEYALCGGDFYARGHIRNIARVVGTDPDPLVAEFDQVVAEPQQRAPRRFATVRLRERHGPNWSAAMAVVLVLVVVYGVAQVVLRSSGGGAKGPVADPTGGTATTAPADPSPSPSASGTVAQAGSGRVTVQVQASGRSWLQASTAGGDRLFRGVVETGQVKTFTAGRSVRLVVGNAGAVSITVNGTAVGAPGQAGEVARVAYGPSDPVAG
jgi:cytoskeletal protein RodZ